MREACRWCTCMAHCGNRRFDRISRLPGRSGQCTVKAWWLWKHVCLDTGSFKTTRAQEDVCVHTYHIPSCNHIWEYRSENDLYVTFDIGDLQALSFLLDLCGAVGKLWIRLICHDDSVCLFFTQNTYTYCNRVTGCFIMTYRKHPNTKHSFGTEVMYKICIFLWLWIYWLIFDYWFQICKKHVATKQGFSLFFS